MDKKQGQKYGRAVLDFDGIHPLPTAEGPILKERGNLPDMPEAVVNRHRQAATIFLHYMESNENFPELPANIVEGETMDVVLNPPEG